MDYEIGSIADLISGNFTPNRPKVALRAVTPVKVPPSPNVTPQLKKEKVRTPQIGFTPEQTVTSSKKLRAAVERDSAESPKSVPQKRKSKLFNNFQFLSQLSDYAESDIEASEGDFDSDQEKPKKKKRKTPEEIAKGKTVVKEYYVTKEQMIENAKKRSDVKKKDLVKKKLKNKDAAKETIDETDKGGKMKNKKNKTKDKIEFNDVSENEVLKKKKNKKNEVEENLYNNDLAESKVPKKKKKISESVDNDDEVASERKSKKKSKKDKNKTLEEIDVGAIGDADEDADKEMEIVKDEEEKEDEEEEEEELSDFQKAARKRVEQKMQRQEKFSEEELCRTIFVGNIPLSILNKNHTKILTNKFSPYGPVENLRIRNIPVVDFKTKPKVALIEKKFHPDRTTVIAYIKFKNPESVDKSLVENNSLIEENHIRVDRCRADRTSVDNRRTVFLGNLPFSVEEEQVRQLFSNCGDIKSVRIVRDRQTQIGKGIGFVNFEKADGVELAMSLGEDNLQLGTKVVRVQRYNASNSSKNKEPGVKRNHLRKEERVVGKRYQQFNQPETYRRPPSGKKRDGEGNKIRKHADKREERRIKLKESFSSRQNEDAVASAKKFKGNRLNGEENGEQELNQQPNTEVSENASTEQTAENKSYKKKEARLEFKGLIAKKKKKMKLQKGILQKKKISKILLQKPKVIAK